MGSFLMSCAVTGATITEGADVIDVGQVNDELKVIEYNGFNSAGFYACDINNIVDAVNRMVEKYY